MALVYTEQLEAELALGPRRRWQSPRLEGVAEELVDIAPHGYRAWLALPRREQGRPSVLEPDAFENLV